MATPVQSPKSDLEIINQQDPQDNPVEKVAEDAQLIITNIVREIDKQERPTREILIKIWKYLDLLWTGVANFYWNSTTNQWKPITYDDVRHLSESADIDPTLLNKTINMLRPYGESIIGAVTTALPRNKYFPEDADSIDDINTARAYSAIEKKICKDNAMELKLIQMYLNMLTGGFFAIHNYSHESESYGTVSQPAFKNQKFQITDISCPSCGYQISYQENPVELDDAHNVESGLNETINEGFEQTESPGPDLQGILEDEVQDEQGIEDPEEDLIQCPNCSSMINPSPDIFTEQRTVPDGMITIPKSRQLFDIYGPLQVKIPTHASRKEELHWCILEDEIHESFARYLYPQYWDKIQPGSKDDLAYDRWARSQYENMGELNQYYVTRRRVWLRPSAYPILGDKEKVELLSSLYPKGCLAVFMNTNFLYAEEEEMDDHWTFSFNPIFRRYYGDPVLKAGIPLQEAANDLFQLELETVKYSIPQTFADPSILDFEAYQNSKAQPGSVYPTKPQTGGKSISEGFFETRTASLPKEVDVLEQKLEKLFQFVLGVFPSVFGGESSGSKTLGEYQQSRNQALMRLAVSPKKVVDKAYAESMGKAISCYKSDLLEDEKYVEQKGNTFVNTWIRKSELSGKVGEVKPEESEQFPMTWDQKKASWMELVGLNNELITAILFNPNNVGFLKEMLSFDDLYVPGDDQRNKQLEEIKELIGSEPIPQQDQMTGVIVPQSSIPVEPIDDNAIHYEVCAAFLCSQFGQTLKSENPVAYQNIMLHAQQHQMIMAQQQAQMMAAQSQDQNQEDPNKVGDANV